MWTALQAEDDDRMRLYPAHHEGDVLAAATMLTVGEHVWYSYAASTSRKREVQPNNAIQRRMMSDAHELGATVYDFGGITDTLDEDNHLLGLLRFKGRHRRPGRRIPRRVELPPQQGPAQSPRPLHVPPLRREQRRLGAR